MMALSARIEQAKRQFANDHGMPPDDPKTLEAFFTHCVLRHRNMSPFLAQQSWKGERKILVGGSQDTQLDAIAIFLNGTALRPNDDLSPLEQLADVDAPIDLSFIFVQATGAELDKGRLTQKIAAFGLGVFSFLDPSANARKGVNRALQEWIALKDRIFEILTEHGIEGCCECAMYFVSPRRIVVDDNIQRAIDAARNAIANHKELAGKIHVVEFAEMGADKIESLISEASQDRPTITIPSSTFVKLPPIKGVAACYVGYLSGPQLLEIIAQPFADGDPQIKSSIFASNVRAFLGLGGRVNASIAGTLADRRQRGQFALRSNGIAIVAHGQRKLPDGSLTLMGAQIVNGCQTSHTLFHNRQHLTGEDAAAVCIPVKIIVTDNKDIEDATILGLNRQTPIDETQLFSQKDLVDRLSAKFKDALASKTSAVLFEARTDEYKHSGKADADLIVTLYDLLYAGSSAFYRTPEQTARRRREQIIEDLRSGAILSKEQDVASLFLCGSMIVAARRAVAAKHSNKWPRYAMKNMLYYCMRLLAEKQQGITDPPRDMHADGARAYFDSLGKVLLDPKLAEKVATRAANIVVDACSVTKLKMNADNARSAALATEVRKQVAKSRWGGLLG
jgi:AIPR protein